MGISGAATPSKSDKASSPVQEQSTVHVYPDWTALQAYYGPGVAMPPPYFTSAVASGHAPSHPYMWGPQPLMPPYGMPYTAIYPHGVFSHPSFPLGSHSHCQGIGLSSTSEAVVMASPLNIATPAKSSSSTGRGFLKRFKRHDGNPVSIGNGTAENTLGSTAPGSSQSGEYGAEGSSDGSDEYNEPGGKKTQRSSSSEDTPPISGKSGKAVTLDNAIHGGKTNSANTTGKPVGITSVSTPGAEGMVPAYGEGKVSATPVPPASSAVVPGHGGLAIELWTQDERDLKRERRKQSNRESARRSRLRKLAESEELALKAETLNAENMTIRSEICQLKDNSQKLRLENSALKEKLKKAQLSKSEEMFPDTIEPQECPPVCTENLLSRINNSSSCNTSGLRENEVHDNSSGRLRQLLDSSPRTDAVAAG